MPPPSKSLMQPPLGQSECCRVVYFSFQCSKSTLEKMENFCESICHFWLYHNWNVCFQWEKNVWLQTWRIHLLQHRGGSGGFGPGLSGQRRVNLDLEAPLCLHFKLDWCLNLHFNTSLAGAHVRDISLCSRQATPRSSSQRWTQL